MEKKTLIIQCSPQRTGSTFLVNAIYGLIPELCQQRIYMDWTEKPVSKYRMAIKTHETDLDVLSNKYSQYNVLFVSSERQSMGICIEDRFRCRDNLVIFDYEELNEREDYPLSAIVRHIYEKVQGKWPHIAWNEDTCLQRLLKMNERYEEIRDRPFAYIDRFYHLHGSHRNRYSVDFVDNINFGG